MAFDAEGALWIICVVSNRLIRVAPNLTWTVVFEDNAPQCARDNSPRHTPRAA